MTPSIEARQLTRRFGSFTAVDRLDLNIQGSKCVGFLGPNGAGKTTALKMFTNLIFPTSGDALINGISVRADRKQALSSCGDLIESPEIYPSLTPREALELVGAVRGLSPLDIRNRTETVLHEVKMMDWIDEKVGRFSKGMKQRVNIAAALLSDPEVVLLDEPSTGLDPRGMAEVRSIIRGLKRERRLIFMSSHILSEVIDVCDEVALIDHGKLLFYDTLAGVNARLGKGATSVDLGFVRPVSDEEIAGRIANLPGVSGVSRVDPQRLTALVTGGPEAQSQLLATLAAAQLGLVSFQPSRSALEEVYMREISQGEA
jgi:ABC-2 type transport system ATP-binding protein